MSGYTKGPWRLGTLDITPFGTGFSMGIDAESHGELATVVWQMEEDKRDGLPSLECEANAKLIATSPELLEELEEYVSHTREILDALLAAGGRDNLLLADRINRRHPIRFKLIAKAKGLAQ